MSPLSPGRRNYVNQKTFFSFLKKSLDITPKVLYYNCSKGERHAKPRSRLGKVDRMSDWFYPLSLEQKKI